LHIDGSIRKATLKEWQPNLNVETFGFKNGMSLEKCLACFSSTVSALNSSKRITRAVREICEDQSNIGVHRTELRFAPHIHGLMPHDAVDAAIRGLDGKSSLILCGLYGDHPDIIASFVDIAIRNKKVVGIDLAGGPLPHHKWKIKDYSMPYRFAAENGIGRTIHAAEGRHPKEIIDAILHLDVQRIGHACTLDASERAVSLVKEKDIVIEACLTSNVHVGVFGSLAEHPIKKWIGKGIRVSICADNTLMSRCNTISELQAARSECNLNEAEIEWIKASSQFGLFEREKE